VQDEWLIIGWLNHPRQVRLFFRRIDMRVTVVFEDPEVFV